MRNKLIFRILGALASALIIVSVFVPFVSVAGYSPSLWETFKLTDSLYLPIMIIVFGAIGVIFFSLNIKTEFAYMSVGAITFFLVIETIDILNQGVFNTLSLGYYFLAIGALLTGIMAFIINLKPRKKQEKVEPVNKIVEPSMLDQIDKLYNEQVTSQTEISPIQPVNTVIEPVPLQPEVVAQVPTVEQISPALEVQPAPETVPVASQPVEQVQVSQVVAPQPVNPVLQEFTQPTVNPVIQEFSVPTQNPVLQEFTEPQPIEQVQVSQVVEPQPVVQEQTIEPLTNTNEPIQVNPVVQEFTNPGSTVIHQQPTNELDIFGQPINK